MLKELFNGEFGLWVWLSKLGALIVINVLTVVCCLPVLTAGASFAAAARVLSRMAEDRESGIVSREFFRAFKANFRTATLAWLLMLAVTGVLGVDVYYAIVGSGAIANFFWVFAIAGLTVAGLALTWLFSLIAMYDGTLAAQMKNALKLTLAKLPQTFLMLLMRIVPVAACALSYRALVIIAPIYMLIGVAATGYLSALTRKPIYEQLSRREKMRYGNGDA